MLQCAPLVNGVKRMTLLVFIMQIGTALSLNTKATRLELHAFSHTPDNDEKDDPINFKQMEPNDYFDDFYNKSEWEANAPNFTPQIAARLMDGTNGANNLCMRDHFVPEVMVIGGIKASTTSLCMMLRQSPALLWPESQAGKVNWTRHPAAWKEGHYFDKHIFQGGISYMIADFPLCTTKTRQVAVDGSARYASDPYVPGIIANWYGTQKSKLKFVLIMREPLDRLHSHYYHSVRDNWCYLHKGTNFSNIINQLLDYWPVADEPHPTLPPRNQFPGCSDFLDGSLYSKQIHNYFQYFRPWQFIFVPFLYNVDPGNAGRSSEQFAEFLWKKLGVNGVPGQIIHSNNHNTPTLEDDLTTSQIKSMREWFEKLTGPAVIANQVHSTEAILYQYTGDRDDTNQIAQWLRENW